MVAKPQLETQVPQSDVEQSRVVLNLLDAIDRQGEQSQRAMADKFGVALGLVNAYIKICVKKGYVKVQRLPPRRYVYLLTPKGMAERLRLTLLLLTRELNSFRRARSDYRQACQEARNRGWRRVALIGACELAEISALCALEMEIEIVAVVDANFGAGRFLGIPVVASLTDLHTSCDGALITDLHDSQAAFARAAAALGTERIIVPAFFGFVGQQGYAA